MTRISSLFVATTLAILPVGAFAQQSTPPVKNTGPSSMTSTTAPVTAPVAGKTANAQMASGSAVNGSAASGSVASVPAANPAQSAKSDVKTPAPGVKTERHSMNTVNAHHAKVSVPAKTADPTKS